jgi:hypothetical protein
MISLSLYRMYNGVEGPKTLRSQTSYSASRLTGIHLWSPFVMSILGLDKVQCSFSKSSLD